MGAIFLFRLERIVFGDAADIVHNLLKNDESEGSDNEELSQISTIQSFKGEQEDDSSEGEDPEGNNEKDDAWSDSDDDTVTWVWIYFIFHLFNKKFCYRLLIVYCFSSLNDALKVQKRKLPSGRPEKTYSEYLRNKFVGIHGKPKWAEDTVQDEDDSDNEILTVTQFLNDFGNFQILNLNLKNTFILTA